MSNLTKSRLFLIASIVFSYLIPSVAIINRYDLLKTFDGFTTKSKFSIIGALLVVSLFIAMFKRIVEYINSLEFSLWKCLVNGTLKVLPLACVAVLIAIMHNILDDLSFSITWILSCNIISKFVLDPLCQYFTKEHEYDVTKTKLESRQ